MPGWVLIGPVERLRLKVFVREPPWTARSKPAAGPYRIGFRAAVKLW